MNLSDAGDAGIDASNANVRVFNASDGSELSVSNTNFNGDVVEFDFATVNTSNTAGINVTLEGVQNPDAGTYDVNTTLYENNDQQGASSSHVASYTIVRGDSELADEGADDTWTTGASLRWQGQGLYINKDEDGVGNGFDNYRVIEWDSTAGTYSDARGATVRELPSAEEVVINTDSLEGDYAVTARNNSGDGQRYAAQTNDQGDVTGWTTTPGDDPYVEVAVQDLSASFADDQVNLGGSTDLELDSNRNGYDVLISSENLSQSQLSAIFNTNDEVGSDQVRVSGVQSTGSITATFNEEDVSEGDYTFDVTADDTTAEDSASLSVGEQIDADASFGQSQYTENRGDVVTVDLETQRLDHALNVTFGGDNVNYEATLEVEPNEDGEIVIDVNTWALSRTDNVNTDAFTVETGTEVSQTESPSNRDRVLDADLYDLTVTDSNNSVAEENIQEYDVAVLNIEERETGEMTVQTAPHASFNDLHSVEDILETENGGALTESSEIAIKDGSRNGNLRGDVAVYEVDVSGLEGAIEEAGGANAREKLTNTGVNFTLQHQNPGPNEDFSTLAIDDLDASNTVVVPDYENDTVYVVLRSNELNDEGFDVGAEFDAEFSVEEDFLNDNYLRSRNHVDADETANGSFSLVDREASFDRDPVTVNPEPDQEISGSTTVAPGTEIRVRARATGESPFLKTGTAVVNEDGSFSALFDGEDSFEGVSVGQNFTATIPRQSFEDDAETDGQVTEGEQADVQLSDVTVTEGDTVDTITVDSAFLPRGGFVTIHDGSFSDGATFDSVRGTSDYLSSGEHSDVEVSLDEPYSEDGEAIAMPHQDTNGNEEYDFVDSDGDEDGAYTDANGDAVTDSASVTFESPETDTPTDTADPDTDTETDTATATDDADDQAGFGAVVALIALLGAALLAARRNAF